MFEWCKNKAKFHIIGEYWGCNHDIENRVGYFEFLRSSVKFN